MSHPLSLPSIQVDGKVVDGLLGDANGVEPPPGRVKDSVKWQKPRFSRKALMKCCLVRWIIASTQPQDKGERHTSDQPNGFLWLMTCTAALALISETVVCICVAFCAWLVDHRVESLESFYFQIVVCQTSLQFKSVINVFCLDLIHSDESLLLPPCWWFVASFSLTRTRICTPHALSALTLCHCSTQWSRCDGAHQSCDRKQRTRFVIHSRV